jgi:DNA-binding NarL/FixJ family response regulator
MNVSSLSREVKSHGAHKAGYASDVLITHVESALAFKGEGRTDLLSRPSRATEGTLVVASALTESRRRWGQRLREGLAVCEVTERRALERIMVNLKPDVLVVDLDLPGLRRLRGLEVIQRLSPSTKILALCETPAESEGVLALKSGARGYCTRTIEPEHLKKAVTAIQQGEIWATRKLVPGLIAELRSLIARRKQRGLRPKADSTLECLTDRQRMVAVLISKGASNKEIATRLKISERTVKAHLTGAFRNVGVSDRLRLALLLQRQSRSSV